MGLRPLEVFLLLQRGDHLYTSESAVLWHQILTYKDSPRTARVKGAVDKKGKLGGLQNTDIY